MNTGFSNHSRRVARNSRSERGIALVIVMISITVLAILAGGFAYAMKVETKLARNANNENELEWLGRSGVEYARWILAQQMMIPQEPYDGLNQVWAGGAGGIGTSNSALADVQKEVKLGNGSFTWKIRDLESKYNINVAPESVLQQGLMVMGVDAGAFPPIVGAILDWIDPDDKPHIEGTESDYYQGLTPPYEAKNGPIDDLSELLLIRGITQEMYWGGVSTNHPTSAVQRKLAPGGASQQAMGFPVGLVDLFTPMSSGKININTASASVLQLIPGMDATMAQGIVGAREGEDDGSGLTGPYRTVDQIRRVPEVNLQVARLIQQFCDVRSRTFEVQVDAQINGYTRTFYAVIGRNNPRDIQILTFYWK
jgi:general secretion pathway protein K